MNILNIVVLFILYVMTFITSFWLIVFLDNLSMLRNQPKPKKKYRISVLIPAFNEGKNIVNCVKSILSQDYPKELVEIIVINDGSTDSTKNKCEIMQRKGWIKLINKKNGGKASALNIGIKKAKGELIYILDADSYADKNSFKNLIGYFNNPKVAAVTSNMYVVSSNSFLRKIQWVEYLFNSLLRKVMSLFNSLYVTPGPGSIYRKSVLVEIGGFSENTLTEDMEIAFNIQNHHYVIENSLNSEIKTNTPKGLRNLVKQRRRWYAGFITDSSSYKHLFFNKDHGLLGLFTLPMSFITTGSLIFLTINSFRELFKELLRFFVNFSSINFDATNFLRNYNLLDNLYSIGLFSIIGVIMLVLSIIIIYYSITLNKGKFNFKSFILSVPYMLFYSPLMCLFWIDAITYKIMTNNKGWKYG